MNTVSTRGVQPPVHQRHLELVLEVGHGAQPPHDGAGLLALGEVHQQPVERLDADAPASPANASRTIATRSSVVNIGVFCSFTRIATTMRSKSRAPRRMMSTWPLVSGSNEPG